MIHAELHTMYAKITWSQPKTGTMFEQLSRSNVLKLRVGRFRPELDITHATIQNKNKTNFWLFLKLIYVEHK